MIKLIQRIHRHFCKHTKMNLTNMDKLKSTAAQINTLITCIGIGTMALIIYEAITTHWYIALFLPIIYVVTKINVLARPYDIDAF